jgi:hypothetical protein
MSTLTMFLWCLGQVKKIVCSTTCVFPSLCCEQRSLSFCLKNKLLSFSFTRPALHARKGVLLKARCKARQRIKLENLLIC